MDDQKSQGVQGPRNKQTVGEPDQSQQPPVQPIFARGDDTSPRTSRQTPHSLRPETPRIRHPDVTSGCSEPPPRVKRQATGRGRYGDHSHRTKYAHWVSGPVKWIAHQHVQLEAGTFDARTLATTIIERSWTMIGFKIDSSRTLRENPPNNWRADWTMDTFLKALDHLHLAIHLSRPG